METFDEKEIKRGMSKLLRQVSLSREKALLYFGEYQEGEGDKESFNMKKEKNVCGKKS